MALREALGAGAAGPLRAALGPLARPIRRLLRRRFLARVRRETGLTPVDETSPQDVFLVGYPKSGNTWLQNLVAGVVHGIDPEVVSDAVVQELVPDVHARALYRRYGTPMFFKSHHLPTPAYRRVVYLLRDGRDAMVSYFHHLGALAATRLDFVGIVRTGRHLFPCKWHEHVEAWLANPHGAALLVIRYEELQERAVEVLRAFCAFAETPRDDAFLARVVSRASFDRMRERERRLGWDHPAWPRGHAFVRRGVVGSHRDEMPRDVLAEFLRQSGPMLLRAGYPLAERDAPVVQTPPLVQDAGPRC